MTEIIARYECAYMRIDLSLRRERSIQTRIPLEEKESVSARTASNGDNDSRARTRRRRRSGSPVEWAERRAAEPLAIRADVVAARVSAVIVPAA